MFAGEQAADVGVAKPPVPATGTSAVRMQVEVAAANSELVFFLAYLSLFF